MQDPGRPILKKPPGYGDPSGESALNKPSARNPPLRKAVLPPSFYHPEKKSKRRKCCRFCYCCFCVSFLLLLLLLVCFGGVFYLWYAPRLPVFRLRPVQFNRFAVTATRDRARYLDARASVWVEVKNPNEKITFRYGGPRLAVMTSDDETELGRASLPGFTQKAGNITMLRFVTRSDQSQVIDVGMATRLNSTVKSGGLRVNVVVKTKVGVGLGEKVTSGMLPVVVSCGRVSLNQLDAGGPPKCKITVLKWIKIKF